MEWTGIEWLKGNDALSVVPVDDETNMQHIWYLTLFSFEKSCICNCFSGAHACTTKSIFRTTFCVNELRSTRNTHTHKTTDEEKETGFALLFHLVFHFYSMNFWCSFFPHIVYCVVSIWYVFSRYILRTEECSYCCHYHPLHFYNGFRFFEIVSPSLHILFSCCAFQACVWLCVLCHSQSNASLFAFFSRRTNEHTLLLILPGF